MTTKTKQPAIMLYTGDWMKDPAVRSVSLAARGMWIDMLCLMHNSPRRGYLEHATGKPVTLEQVARMTGCSTDEASRLLQELTDSGVCSVSEHGVVYCRRMVREAHVSQVRSEAGRKGVCSSKHPSKASANREQSEKQKAPPSSSVSPSASASFPRSVSGGTRAPEARSASRSGTSDRLQVFEAMGALRLNWNRDAMGPCLPVDWESLDDGERDKRLCALVGPLVRQLGTQELVRRLQTWLREHRDDASTTFVAWLEGVRAQLRSEAA